MDSQKSIHLLDQAFSPSAPITEAQFFFGRIDHLDEVVDGINERGQHIVVYGERGVGKTSFAGNVATKLGNIFPVKVTCNRTDGFRKIWDKAFERVRFEQSSTGIGFVPAEQVNAVQLDLFLPNKDDITSLDVLFVLEKINANLLFVFDEYDTVEDQNVASEMADTIKSLSDNAPKVTIMLVGVGATVLELIGGHESIERCLRQIRLPRMSNDELGLILENGAKYLKLTFDPKVKDQIVSFSQGFPHFTHLLGKQACRAALEDDSNVVLPTHFEKSVSTSVSRVDESVRSSYQRATMMTNGSPRFQNVLWACARATEDEHTSFSASDIAESYSEIVGKKVIANELAYYIGQLCSPVRGSVLEKIGSTRNFRYMFKNPLLRAYTTLKEKVDNGKLPNP